MEVSPEKTAGTIFTLDPAEARKECVLTLGIFRLQHEATFVFLGIRFDRTLSYRQHIECLKVKMKRGSPASRSLSGKSSCGCGALHVTSPTAGTIIIIMSRDFSFGALDLS